ncbi:MAG: hypothetical protein JO142_12035 [Burkholderiales bacterium]|nr:hypothetical protein [Burkholderiales bacterium]
MRTSVSGANTLVSAAGSTQQFHACLGDVVVVEAGRVVLEEAPSWLADTVYRTPITLAEGEAHQIARTGWVTLYAHAAARLQRYPAAGKPARETTFLSTWRHRVARLMFSSFQLHD